MRSLCCVMFGIWLNFNGYKGMLITFKFCLRLHYNYDSSSYTHQFLTESDCSLWLFSIEEKLKSLNISIKSLNLHSPFKAYWKIKAPLLEEGSVI